MVNSVAERWDTWTRSEIMAVRGYGASSSSAVPVGRSGMTTDDKLEVNGSQSVPSALSNPEAVAGATNGSASLPGPRVLPARRRCQRRLAPPPAGPPHQRCDLCALAASAVALYVNSPGPSGLPVHLAAPSSATAGSGSRGWTLR